MIRLEVMLLRYIYLGQSIRAGLFFHLAFTDLGAPTKNITKTLNKGNIKDIIRTHTMMKGTLSNAK